MRLALPPAVLPARPVVHVLARGTCLVRFYNPTLGPWHARRTFGPLSDVRFDHHRLPLGSDDERAVWYASTSLQGALAESFGRLGVIDRESDRRVVVAHVTRDLRLLDLVGVAARRMGLTQEIASSTDYACCQAWARAFYAQYRHLVGVRWRGRQAGSVCVVLTDRAPRSALALDSDHELSDPAVWPRITRAARRCGLTMV